MKKRDLSPKQPVFDNPDALISAIKQGAQQIQWQPGYASSSDAPVQRYHPKHQQPVDCVAALAQSQFLTGSQDGTIQVWSTSTLSPLRSYKKHKHAITSLTQCGDYVASADCSGQVHIWNPLNGKQKTSFSAFPGEAKKDRLHALANHQKNLAILSKQNGLSFWSYKKKNASCTSHTKLPFTALDAQRNKEGSLIVISGSDCVILYNLNSAEEIKRIQINPQFQLQSCVFFQQQRLFAYGKADKDNYLLIDMESAETQSCRAQYQARNEEEMVEVPITGVPLSHYHVALFTTHHCQILDVAHNTIVSSLNPTPHNITVLEDGNMLYHRNKNKELQLFTKTTIQIDLSSNIIPNDVITELKSDHSLEIRSKTKQDLQPTKALLQTLFSSRNYLFNHHDDTLLVGNIPKQEMDTIEALIATIKSN